MPTPISPTLEAILSREGLPGRRWPIFLQDIGGSGMYAWRLGARYGWVALLLGLIAIERGPFVLAQAPAPPPVPEANPAPAAAPAPPLSREALLEERLRKLEAMNQTVLQQYETMERRQNQRYEKLSQEFKALQERLKAESARGESEGDPAGDGDGGRPVAGGGARGPIDRRARETHGTRHARRRSGRGPTEPPGGTAGRAGAAPGEPFGRRAARGPQGDHQPNSREAEPARQVHDRPRPPVHLR